VLTLTVSFTGAAGKCNGRAGYADPVPVGIDLPVVHSLESARTVTYRRPVTEPEAGPMRPGPAAKLLGITTRTLADWSDAGIISAIVTPGGHRRYREADIEELLHPSATPKPPTRAQAAGNHGATARRGRPLTDAEACQPATPSPTSVVRTASERNQPRPMG